MAVGEYGGDRTRVGGSVRGLLARVAGLLYAGRDRRDADAQLVCGGPECGMRSRPRDREKAQPPNVETLPGSEAVRAPGRNSAAYCRRDARVHLLGRVEPS